MDRIHHGTFIIFSPYNTDNISGIQKFIIHTSKMRKQKPIEVEELSQNYTTTRYQKLVWAHHSVLKGPVFINISKVFQQTEIKAILILSTSHNRWEWPSISLFISLLMDNMDLFVSINWRDYDLLLVPILLISSFCRIFLKWITKNLCLRRYRMENKTDFYFGYLVPARINFHWEDQVALLNIISWKGQLLKISLLVPLKSSAQK